MNDEINNYSCTFPEVRAKKLLSLSYYPGTPIWNKEFERFATLVYICYTKYFKVFR